MTASRYTCLQFFSSKALISLVRLCYVHVLYLGMTCAVWRGAARLCTAVHWIQLGARLAEFESQEHTAQNIVM